QRGRRALTSSDPVVEDRWQPPRSSLRFRLEHRSRHAQDDETKNPPDQEIRGIFTGDPSGIRTSLRVSLKNQWFCEGIGPNRPNVSLFVSLGMALVSLHLLPFEPHDLLLQ